MYTLRVFCHVMKVNTTDLSISYFYNTSYTLRAQELKRVVVFEPIE